MLMKDITLRRASRKDIEAIHDIITYYSGKGLILYRTKGDISENLGTFFVAENGSSFKGVVSFYDYGEKLKEVRSLAVVPEEGRKGVGTMLVGRLLESLAGTCGSPKVFVLTYSPDFFLKNGFEVVDKATLPEKIWKDCQNCPHRDNCKETALVYQL